MIIQRRIPADHLSDYVWRDVKHEIEYDKAKEYLEDFKKIDPHHTYRLIDVILD